jgi:NADH-quinone oxidoreductase subunit J
MEPVATPFFFYGLSAVAILGALGVVTRRNPVHSAISLIFTLLALAGLYLMLYAPFVAGVQIILYAGGITVLFLFVMMLVSLERALREEQFNKQWLVGLIVTVILGGLVAAVYIRQKPFFTAPAAALPEESNVQMVGLMLYRDYMLPFEIASVLLLVAMVGAVVMAKRSGAQKELSEVEERK